MNEYDDILNRIVEEFYDTGRLVLKEKNDTEEGITYDIEEYVNDLIIPEIDPDHLEFLLKGLGDEDKESVEVNNIDVINYLKDEDKDITLKDKNLKSDAEVELCNSLGGKDIEDYIKQVKVVWEEHNISENARERNEYLRGRNKEFCDYWYNVLSNCDTNKYFFKYCTPIDKLSIKHINEQNDPVVDIESQIEDNINNGEEYSNLRNRRYNLYSALNHFNVANNLIIQLLRDEELSEESFEGYLELGEYLERRMVNIINLIRTQQNQTNQEGETENVPEDEEEIIDLDSEEDEVVVDEPNEDEEDEVVVDEPNEDDGYEEETVTIEHNLFDLFKNNVKDKNILYGQWKIKEVVVDDSNEDDGDEIEDGSVILKRENLGDELENLLFELGVDDVEVSIKDLKEKIGDKNWEKYENGYKNTILKNPNDFTLQLSRNIFSSGKKGGSEKTVTDLFKKANLIIDNIILYLNTNEKWVRNSKYIEYHNKLLKLITAYTDRNSSTKELDLYEVVYDLYQLYERIKDKGIDVLDKNLMDKLFSGEFNKIRDVFNEVRKNNNLDYERSFEKACEGEEPSFKKETDDSTILDVKQLPEEYQKKKKWNQYLKSKIQSTATTESIIKEFRGMLINKVDKYDLITQKDVTLTSLNGKESLVIPNGRKVEVKKIKYKNRKGEYKDYIMSEFLSLYKNENPESDEDKIKYEEIINGILSAITSEGGIGDEVIQTMTNDDNGIFGIFYEDYIFIPMNNIDVSWNNRGHGKGSEDRISLRIKIKENPNIYVWKEGNPNCGTFKFDGCKEKPGCTQNESTDRLDNIIETFFDTGKFIL